MLIYEIQGIRYFAEPEQTVKRKMFSKHPPNAEVIVWDGDKVLERLQLIDLFNAGT